LRAGHLSTPRLAVGSTQRTELLPSRPYVPKGAKGQSGALNTNSHRSLSDAAGVQKIGDRPGIVIEDTPVLLSRIRLQYRYWGRGSCVQVLGLLLTDDVCSPWVLSYLSRLSLRRPSGRTRAQASPAWWRAMPTATE